MKDYINVLIKDKSLTPVDVEDAIITDPKDDLFDLQEKYGVKISRSNKSDAVYIFKSRNKFVLRIGHPMTKEQYRKHIHNYSEEITTRKVDYNTVEEGIKQYLNRF